MMRGKRGRCVLFCCLLCLFLADIAGAETLFTCWDMQPSDGRRVLPNNPAPPERRMSSTHLAPLPSEEQGTIRRVDIPHGDKVAALTFDMCELATITTGCDMAILGFLRGRRIPATLFMGGKWMRTHSGRVRQIMTEPLFEIANHAWSHGNFGIMKPERMREEIFWTQAQYELLREETLRRAETEGRAVPNIPPVPTLFRLPYGRCTDEALDILAEAGLRVIQWDVVAETATDNGRAGLGRHLAERVHPGSILLFHANLVPQNSFALLRDSVEELQRRGYRFVTVGELLHLGEPRRDRDGYFNKPGDNRALDTRFGIDGTGRR